MRRGVVVPFAVALDDLDQVIDRLLAAALAGERDREIEPGLMIERIGRDLRSRSSSGPDRLRLLGELERGTRGRHRGIVALGLRHHRERRFSFFERTAQHVDAGKPGERGDVGVVLRQYLRVELGGAGGIVGGERGHRRL